MVAGKRRKLGRRKLGRRKLGRLAAGVLMVLTGFSAAPTAAQPPNGGFEDGNLGGWTAGGGLAVEVLEAGAFNNPITPSEGMYFALLSSGPGNGPGPGGDFDGNGTNDFDSSTLSITIDVMVAPASLSFDWVFLTAEFNQNNTFDDLFLVSLDGTPILTRSVNKPGGVSPFPDTLPTDLVNYQVTSAGPTNGSSFPQGRTPFQTFCFHIGTTGLHILQFLLADQGDNAFDSGLLLDNLQLPSACDPTTTQITNTSGANVEVKGGAFSFEIQENREVASSDDGTVLAFISNGDHTSDNPNLQTQVFVATGGSFERVTAMTGADAKSPALTSNGRFLTFAASGDLTPGSPGNADGNFEIFRWDRTLSLMVQVTDTTGGCVNSHPTISHNTQGRRIAFATNCTDLVPGFNADGNSEVVIWDATGGTFQTDETTGCTNRSPAISQHDAGQFVSFVSDCDLTGGNLDGNFEIFQWDRLGGGSPFTQITVTSAIDIHNDSASSSFDGRFVSFASNADLTPFGNADPFSTEVFRWDRMGGTFQQLTSTAFPAYHSTTSIDDSGRFVGFERFDLIAETNETGYIDANTVTETMIASNTTGESLFHAVSAASGTGGLAFQASGNTSGNNGDGNQEIWFGSTAFSPSDPDAICNTPNLAIPNNDPVGVTDTQTVVSTKTVSDLDVYVRIAHNAVRDLIVTLRHTDTGTTVTLIDRPGTPPGQGCRRNNIATILDDEAASPVENECVNQATTIFGTFTPDQPLTAFDGESYDGMWSLNVSDNRNGNTGTFNEWCLLFTP